MTDKDVNNGSGFSWKSETDDALGSYIEKGKNKSGYASSIFSSKTDFSEKSSLNNDYKYDFPKDDGYIYSPLSYTSSSQSKSDIFSTVPSSKQGVSRPESRETAAQRRPAERKPTATKGKEKKAKNTKTKKKSSFLDFGKSKNKKAEKSKEKAKSQRTAPSGTAQRGSSQRPPQRPPQKAHKNNRAREAERQRREQERLSRNNSRFDSYRNQGKSADEGRRARMREKKRRRKLISVLCVCVLVAGVLIASGSYIVLEGAPVVNIKVEGSTTYKKNDILSAGGIAVGDNMLLIRENKTSSTISQALPYIESVKVKYELPDTLKLTVKETTDKIHIVLGKSFLTLDENGKVLSNKKKKVANGCYKLLGFEKQDYNIGHSFSPDENNGNKEKYETALEIISALEKTGISQCREISFEDMKCITVSYGEGISIYVDTKTDYERQLSLAKDALSEKNSTNAKSYFDLRYDNMVVHN